MAVADCGLTRSWRLPSFQINDYRLAGGYAGGDHLHPWPSLAIGLSGTLGLDLGGTGHWLQPGSALAIPEAKRHAERARGKGARVLLVIPSPGRLDSIMSLEAGADRAKPPPNRPAGLFEQCRSFENPALAGSVQRLAHELESSGVAASLTLEARLLEIVAALSRQQHSPVTAAPMWLRRVRRELDLHFLDAPLQAELAQMAGVSREHLARSFRKIYGCTVGEYLRSRRLFHSGRRLRESNLPIAEIALECGFADQSHFTRVFRLHYGATPAAYRRRYR